MERTFDHVPDRERDTVTVTYHGTQIPDAHSLESYECPVLDQGSYGACGGHGSAQGLYIRYNVLGHNLGWIPSPAEIYAAARSVTRADVELGDLEALTDIGVQPADMMKSISIIGICPMQEALTPDGRFSDVDANTVNKELSLDVIEAAGRKVPVGEYRLNQASPTFVEDICYEISQGVPVGLGIWVDAAFQAYNGTTPLNTVDMTPQPGSGWHWVCAVAYRTDPILGRIIKIVNSWGVGWGDGTGHCELTGNRLMESTSDAYPFAIGAS